MEMLEKLKKGVSLGFEEASAMFDEILSGSVEEPLMEAVLLALSEKGESEEEIAAAASAMRKHAVPFKHGLGKVLDIVGTGGDGSHSFNISSGAAILSSLFIPVIKHGNRAMSSKSGSADVLEALGIPIGLGPEEGMGFLEKKNFTFLFAQKYHPSMKSVAGVRKKIGKRTIFNLLGPLCSPANPNYMLIGLFRENFLDKYMGAIERLEMPNVTVVSSRDGMDEISISDTTVCCQKKGMYLKKFDFDPREFGIYADRGVLQGYDAQTNAKIMREVFKGEEHGDLANAIAINAAFALTLAEVEPDLKAAFSLAREAIKSGKAYEKLMELAS